MKQKKHLFKIYGLRSRLCFSLIIDLILCSLLFGGLYFSMNYFLNHYFERSDFEEQHIKVQGKSLQNYVDENNISSKNIDQLESWERKQPVILLELYKNETCIYSSFYDVDDDRHTTAYETFLTEATHAVPVKLADMDVQALLFSDFTYQYFLIGTAASLIISLIIFLMLFLKSNQKIIRYICRLNEEVQILEGGNLEYQVSVKGNDEITELAKSMNRMRISFQQQMETEHRLYQANHKLITEMSHDLRTPLTSIMLYLEILRSHKYNSESELQEYLEKIDAKAHHMKLLSDHLFEYSLENKPEKQSEPVGMEQALADAIHSFTDDLETRGFSVALKLDWLPCFVQIKQEYIHRIFENIASNLIKYAEMSEKIQITTIEEGSYCGFSVLNTCSADSEQQDSNRIGIESIRTMMKQMNGICTVEQTDVVFEITLLFPKR